MSMQIKALKAQQPLMEKHLASIEQAYMVYDGYSLDYMNINVDLTKQQDFEALIKFLEIHKNCFWRKSELTKITLNKNNNGTSNKPF